MNLKLVAVAMAVDLAQRALPHNVKELQKAVRSPITPLEAQETRNLQTETHLMPPPDGKSPCPSAWAHPLARCP